MTAYLWGVAAIVAGVALPGLAFAALCDRGAPDRVSPERFLALALATGLSWWVLLARVLDRAGGLTRGPAFAALVASGVASIVVAVGPGRPTLRALATRDTGVFAGWAFGSTLLGAAPLLRIVVDQRDALIGSTPWYYWSLIRQTVAAGGSPSRSWEWGRSLPFLDDYPGFTPAVALLALPGKAATLAAAHLVEVMAMLGAGLAVFLLVRALGGSRWGAALATLLFFAADVFATKLVAIRPESTGYVFALLAPVLALEFLRTRERRLLIVIAATFGALGLVHGIDWLFGIAVLAGAVAAAIPGRSSWRAWLAGALAVAAVTVAAWAFAGLVLGGSLSGASSLGDLPEVEAGIDPTWRFAQVVQGSPSPDPPSVGRLVATSLDRGLRSLGSPWFVGLAAIVVAVLAARAMAGGPLDRLGARRTLIFLAVTAATALVIALTFVVGWTTYVPRRTGFARLFQVALLLVPIGAGVAVSELVDTPARRAAQAILVAGGATLVFVGVIAVRGQGRLDAIAEQRPSAAELGALRDVPIRDGAVVLTNGYSEGLVPVVTGARGVLDGRAPYTDSPLLARANTLLGRSTRFFRDPLAGDASLPCAGVEYLLVAQDSGRTLGMPSAFPTDSVGLDQRRDLRLVGSSPGVRIYRVVDPTEPADGPGCRPPKPPGARPADTGPSGALRRPGAGS
jgi:hypothetical protein